MSYALHYLSGSCMNRPKGIQEQEWLGCDYNHLCLGSEKVLSSWWEAVRNKGSDEQKNSHHNVWHSISSKCEMKKIDVLIVINYEEKQGSFKPIALN